MSEIPVKTGILLAAGLSRRFGAENKLLALWKGRPLVEHAIAAAIHSALSDVILVTGQDGDAIAALGSAAKITRAHNPDFLKGLSSSLQVGLAVAPDGPVMVLLADMPIISSALIDELLGAWRAGAYALVPEHKGRTGNPVILSPAARIDASGLTGDRGAKKLFDGRSDVIRRQVSDASILCDFDAEADFKC